MAVLAQGTEIFYIDPDATTGNEVVKVACPKTINPGTPSTDEHDTTNLCSTAKEKFLGLTDWGTCTINVDYDSSKDSIWRLVELSEQVPRPTVKFFIGMPGNTTPPEFDTSGHLQLSKQREWRSFEGQVMSVAVTAEAGNVLPGDIEISISKREPTLRAGRA